jgi:hypothetical protein
MVKLARIMTCNNPHQKALAIRHKKTDFFKLYHFRVNYSRESLKLLPIIGHFKTMRVIPTLNWA